MPSVNVVKRLFYSQTLQKDNLERHLQNSLQTSYDHFKGEGELSRKGQELFKVAFCSYYTPVS